MTVSTRSASSTRPRTRAHNAILYTLLGLVLVAGFALRVWNINFDRGTGSHPDERSTACFYARAWRCRRAGMNCATLIAVHSTRCGTWSARNGGFTYGHHRSTWARPWANSFTCTPVAEQVGVPAEAV
ncbi:MAG: hypothetical protein R3A10_20715 [Caldilineaceae bacterium]